MCPCHFPFICHRQNFSEIHFPNTSVPLRCLILFLATWNGSPEFGYIKELMWSCNRWMISKNMAIEVVIHFDRHSFHFTVSCAKHGLWIACKCSSVWWNNYVTPKINRWCCWCFTNCLFFYLSRSCFLPFFFACSFLSIYIYIYCSLCAVYVWNSFYSRSKALVEMMALGAF